jgi:adenylate kinase
MKDVVLAGMQACGKDTQAAFLVEAGYQLVGTGQALRDIIEGGGDLGLKIKAIIDKGDLLGDEDMKAILKEKLMSLDLGKPILFNGYPRNLAQLDVFKDLMREIGHDFSGVYIDLEKDAALERISGRRVCGECALNYPISFTGEYCSECAGELIRRADDSDMEAVEKRIDTFLTHTKPVFDKIDEEGGLIKIDGSGSIDDVKADIFNKLGI